MFGRKLLFAILGLTLWVDSAISETVEVTARSGLKFRSRTTGGVYSVIPRGTQLEVEGRSGNWVYVRYNGKRGKVHKKYAPVVDEGGRSRPDDSNSTADDNDYRGGGSRFDTSLRFSCSGGRKNCKNTKWFNPRKADSGACGDVVVNCATHKISFSGINVPARERVINCGKYGKTKDGVGTIGGSVGGKRVPNAININIRGMGTPAGGKWFHVPWWNGDMRPTGINSSRGCIHISPHVMALLKRCNGSKLTIKGSYGPRNRNSRDTDEGEAQGRY
jgi:hypothetical protein